MPEELASFIAADRILTRLGLQAIAFVVVTLIAKAIARRLFRRLVYAFSPEAEPERYAVPDRPMRVALAIADILAWWIALVLTGAVVGLPLVSQLLTAFFGVLWNLLPLMAIVALVAYCFSRTGNELILSLLGAWYLHHRKAVLEDTRYFDLGNGQLAEIQKIALLDTEFNLKNGGKTVSRPNAFLMRSVFGFSETIGIEGLWLWLQSHRQSSNRTQRSTDSGDPGEKPRSRHPQE